MLEEDQYKGIVSWGSKGESFIVKVSPSRFACLVKRENPEIDQ